MEKKIVLQEKLAFKGREGIPATVQGQAAMPECIKCMLCWVHCPDTAIKQRQDGFPYSKYIECKGCGACAEVCPVKCIEMQRNRNDGIERSDLLQFRKEA